MNHDELIDKAKKLIQIRDRQIDGLRIPDQPRYRIAGGCFYIAMEHQKAIVLLVAKQLYGPALSLVRPIYEAFLRGIWIYKCASERQLEDFIKGKVPKLFCLLKDVEKLEGYQSKELSALKDQYGENMNAYVHTGVQQVVRLQMEKAMEPNYHKDEIADVLQLANFFGCMSAINICDMCGRLDKMQYIYEKFVEY